MRTSDNKTLGRTEAYSNCRMNMNKIDTRRESGADCSSSNESSNHPQGLFPRVIVESKAESAIPFHVCLEWVFWQAVKLQNEFQPVFTAHDAERVCFPCIIKFQFNNRFWDAEPVDDHLPTLLTHYRRSPKKSRHMRQGYGAQEKKRVD